MHSYTKKINGSTVFYVILYSSTLRRYFWINTGGTTSSRKGWRASKISPSHSFLSFSCWLPPATRLPIVLHWNRTLEWCQSFILMKYLPFMLWRHLITVQHALEWPWRSHTMVPSLRSATSPRSTSLWRERAQTSATTMQLQELRSGFHQRGTAWKWKDVSNEGANGNPNVGWAEAARW